MKIDDGQIILDEIDEAQKSHIQLNRKISILTIDPSNIGRWFCIRGIIEPIEADTSNFHVNIIKTVIFPKPT